MAAAAPALNIEPLSDRHDRPSFASGVERLDRYLPQQAGQDAHRRVAACFVLTGDDARIPIDDRDRQIVFVAVGRARPMPVRKMWTFS